jgi:hypothetical protein
VEGGDETRAAAAGGDGGNRDDDELIDHDGFFWKIPRGRKVATLLDFEGGSGSHQSTLGT